MREFDIDDAMCTYLGGDAATAAIQIGMRDERLAARYGELATTIKPELDVILDTAVRLTRRRENGDGPSIAEWLFANHPDLDALTRRKIESHVLYFITH